MANFSLEERDKIVEMLGKEYLIPSSFRDTVKEGIKKYANKNYTDEKLNEFVKEAQSPKSFFYSINPSLAHFSGYFYEWLMCLDYNSRKNTGNVLLTIVNPDSTSKADLLHIIQTKTGYKCIAGPDVKSGQPSYVLEQYEKLINEKIEIPFIDMCGHLTKNKEQLKPKQREKLEKLMYDHPRKKPLSPQYDLLQYRQLVSDYLIYETFQILPSKNNNHKYKIPTNPKEYAIWKSQLLSAYKQRQITTFTYLNTDYNPKREKNSQSIKSRKKNHIHKDIMKTKDSFKNREDKSNNVVSMYGNNSVYKQKSFIKQAAGIVLKTMALGAEVVVKQKLSDIIYGKNIKTQKREDNSNTKLEKEFNKTNIQQLTEHKVQSHEQRYHTREGTIIKSKDSYIRNKKD